MTRRVSRALVALCAAASSAGAQAPEPITLHALLDSVAHRHPLVQAADARVRGAEGSRVTAHAFGNPSLGYQLDNTPFPGARTSVALDREAMTTLTLPLEGLYQRGPRSARANADVRAATADAAWTRQRVGLDAAAAFYRAAFAQVKAATTHDLASWLDSVVTYQRSRVKEGVAAESDLIRSELEGDRVAADATMDDAELAQAKAALGALIGDPRAVGITLSVAVESTPSRFPLALFAAGGPSAALIQTRPDIGAARERVASANAAVGVEHSLVLRQLGATIGTKRTVGTTSMIAGFSLPIPVFDPNRGEIQRADADRDAANFELTAQERTANAELLGAYTAARLLTDRATTLARGDSTSFLARADEARRIALAAYREGAVPLIQIIDVARAWGDARLTFYRTLFAQRQSVLTLVVAGGFDIFTYAPGIGR